MRESIFFASIRAFFITCFAVIGFFAGFIVLIIAIGALSDTSKEVERTYTTEVVTNAEGVRKQQGKEVPVILQLNIDGFIGTEKFSMETVEKQLVESREGDLKDNRVKAILLRINSPGGAVVDSAGIYNAIKWYKKEYKVPVYAYVDGLCASGAMFIACAADKVYSSDTGLIGSVGVIMPSFFNVTQLMEKIGIESRTLYAGKGKDELNPFRPWTKEEDDSMKSLIDYYYKDFVNIVASNRPNMNKEKLVNEYGAKLFDPLQAKEYGYIDEAGLSRFDVLKLLLKEIGVTDDKYQVVELQKRFWYSDLYAESSLLLQGKVVHQIQLAPQLDPALMNQFLYLYQP